MLLLFLYIFILNGFLNIQTPEAVGEDNITRKGKTSEIQSEAPEDVIDIDEFLGNLPPHLTLLQHQAAGHTFSQKQRSLGILKDSHGYVLKPTREKIVHEVKLYKEVQNGKHSKLAPLIPAFYGTVSVPYRDKPVEFIKMEDLTHGFEKPCVLDVKIGKITWGPDASEEKIRRQKEKHKETKEIYGFCLSGYVLINPITNEKTKPDRETFYNLDAESVVKDIEKFVHVTENSQATAVLVKGIISELKRILEWASTQTELRLYASSIVIIYDSQALLNLIPKIKKGKLQIKNLDIVRVKMVDFAHTLKAPENEGIDENYLPGVKSLLTIFQNILKKHKELANTSHCSIF